MDSVDTGKATENCDQELKDLNTRISGVKKSIDSYRVERDKLSVSRDKDRIRIQTEIIKNADVVLSTLSGSGHDMLGVLV